MNSSTFLRLLNRQMRLTGVLILTLFLVISFSFRSKDFIGFTGVENMDATYHTLLTMKALKENSIENHWFLPTVSLGKSRDKNIPWGATVPTKTGDYIYTSFAPPGFLVPYIVFEVFNIESSRQNIARFNFIIGSLVSFVLYALLVKVLERLGYSLQISVAGAVLGTTISIFSKEVLQSHGLVYWIHSFYQLILISGLYLLFAYLNTDPGRNGSKDKYAAYLVVSVFLGAWTEWTGYVFGMGLAILFWFGGLINLPQRGLSIKLVIAVAAAGILTLTHYGLVVGFEPAVNPFIARFLGRNIAVGNLVDLLNGYVQSFSLFLLVTFAAVTLIFFLKSRTMDESHLEKNKVAFLFFAATIPLFENFIMLEHATQFSFDRLKFLFPLAIIISLIFARLCNMWRLVLAVLLVFASIEGYSSYRSSLSRYSSWFQVDFKNKLLANSIIKLTDIQCSVLLSNIAVRGYSNLLFNRGIFEHKSKNDASELMKKTNACSAIYLEGVGIPLTDLVDYKNAVLTKEDGSSFSLTPLDIGIISPDFFVTDSNWQNGVARNWAGFFVPNTDNLKLQLTIGSDLIFQNGEVRKIVNVVTSGSCLNVYVDGALLNPTNIGQPTTYILRSTIVYGR